MALPDYSCLFENNNDAMFDAKLFGVAIVSPEAFARFEKEQLHYDYAWKYDTEPATDAEEKEVEIDFKQVLLCRAASVRDLWMHEDLGEMKSFHTMLPPHGCRVLKLSERS